jgi:hypothetical protein
VIGFRSSQFVAQRRETLDAIHALGESPPVPTAQLIQPLANRNPAIRCSEEDDPGSRQVMPLTVYRYWYASTALSANAQR